MRPTTPIVIVGISDFRLQALVAVLLIIHISFPIQTTDYQTLMTGFDRLRFAVVLASFRIVTRKFKGVLCIRSFPVSLLAYDFIDRMN